MTGLLGQMGPYQKPAKKHKVPKRGGETTSGNTQVGELDDEIKEPTPAMRLRKTAQDEKHYATRKWVAGEITDAHHKKVHARANHVIKNARKYSK